MTKGKDPSHIDPINTHLFDEIQTRANQLGVKACLNLSFYNRDNVQQVYSNYQRKSVSQKQSISIKALGREDGTIVASYKSGPGGVETLDIILVAQQDIDSVMFESLKAIIWYQWFSQFVDNQVDQLNCLIDDEGACTLFLYHFEKDLGNRLEEIAVCITGMLQTIEHLDTETTNQNEPQGTPIEEEE